MSYLEHVASLTTLGHVDRAILRLLLFQLLCRVELNAALGYALEPSWPAPEEFERPGWDVKRAPRGMRKVAYYVDTERIPLWSTPDDVCDPVEIETATCEPAVWAQIRTSRAAAPMFGIGFDTDQRVLWLFQWWDE